MHGLGRIAALVTLSALTGAALAQNEVRVEIHTRTGGGCDGSTTTFDRNDGQAINITVDSCVTRINIYDHDGADGVQSAGLVTISGNGATDLELFFGQGAFPTDGSSMPVALTNLAGVTISDSTQRDETKLAGRLAGDLTGAVHVGELFRFDVDDEIKAQIRAKIEGGVGLFLIEAGSITSSGSVLCDDGTIGRVRVVNDIAGPIEATNGSIGLVETTAAGGDLLADVKAPNEEINTITIAGNIGAPEALVNILAGKDIDCLGGGICEMFRSIEFIEAEAIWANIKTDNVDRGDLQKLTTRSGDFIGELDTHSIKADDVNADALDIAGDIDADILIAGTVVRPIEIAGELNGNHLFRIADRFPEESGFTFSSSTGLKGQIIINAGDVGAEWEADADITIGSTTLGPIPYYTQTSAGFGGGAVGLAPFSIHHEDCDPPSGTTVNALPSKVVLMHYGPVHRVGTDLPVKLERRPIGGGTWVDVSDDFKVVGLGSSAESLDRKVTIEPKPSETFLDDSEYRITPVPGRLKCCHVDGCPDVDWDEEYSFQIDL